MANPRLIKKRVGSIKNISKITKALEMVSASRVKKAQAAALNAKPYARTIYELVSSLAERTQIFEIPLLRIPKLIQGDLYIILSTNRGLAGSLNTNLFRFVANYLVNKKDRKHFFVTVGKKGRSFAHTNGELVADFSDEKEVESVVSSVTQLITEGFTKRIYDAVYVVYSDFVTAFDQEPRVKKLLPISKKSLEEDMQQTNFGIHDNVLAKDHQTYREVRYSYEPDAVTVLGELIRFYLEVQIAESLYESQASEHSARTIAMKNATENASALSTSLEFAYNQVRQSLITTEISDITTAQLSIGGSGDK